MRESGRCFLRIITDLTFYTIFIRFNPSNFSPRSTPPLGGLLDDGRYEVFETRILEKGIVTLDL